jgi:Spy/CpxP family protein refolding chaperone
VKSTTFQLSRLTGQSTALERVPTPNRWNNNLAVWTTIRRMQDAFAIVLFVVVGVAVVAAIWALVTSGGSYDDIGGGRMALDRQESTPVEREAEIRQMLAARNALREARGEAALDVDAEYRALTSAEDPELREEIRQLVEATNARRVSRGEEPLDVEAEIDRRLRELG